MTVWLGNYAIATDNNDAYNRQRDTIKAAIQTYGTDHIGGVTVGNEFMLKYVSAFPNLSCLSVYNDLATSMTIMVEPTLIAVSEMLVLKFSSLTFRTLVTCSRASV